MKTLSLVIIALIACSCSVEPVLRVRDYDRHNNRVDEKGNLVPFTNWGVGFYRGTNWIKILQAEEK